MLLAALVAVVFFQLPAHAQLRPSDLRCEYATNPLGIESTSPRLSWILDSTDPKARGERQTAYQIEVASTPQLLSAGRADLWRATWLAERWQLA